MIHETLRLLFDSPFLSSFFLPSPTILESFVIHLLLSLRLQQHTITLSPVRCVLFLTILKQPWMSCVPTWKFLIILMLYRSTQAQKSRPVPWRRYILEAQRLLFLIAFSVSSPFFSVSQSFFQCLSSFLSVDFHFSVFLSIYHVQSSAHSTFQSQQEHRSV